jgi:hypothetical protein
MLRQFEANSHLARNIDQYEFDIDTQLRVEREIGEALESAPSMYSDKVSQRARDAWEERLWMNIERHRHFRVRDQQDIASDRPGRRLHIVQFIRILNSLPRRKFMLNPWTIRGMRGVSLSRGGKEPQYIMALDSPIIPEWSHLELDEHGLPKKLTSRGWRAVLLTLLDNGYITEDEMLERFGFAGGIAGGLFRKYLFEHRNHSYAAGEEWHERVRLRPAEIGE